ncbi:HEAT repeat domain-containing protein [Neochlamydia sp. EPS4]|uniref:HEAT repeat domain-containing protein n=1 Tax=Neochlamydia sp. EPS4 TaxID=1478175 RepID=UPI0005D0EF7B|nr:HEAT repeat domain-containing protein [Neochlamydia sp. EPS4]
MTAIYERIVNWMYKWFLLRRIDQGKSNQTKEKILTEKNLRHNQEVAKIATAFEEMADFAMKNNTLYLGKQEIDDFRGDAITSNELADCGLIRIPEEKGYFIHLTFQEFLTASKFANQYLKGKNRQACQNFVRNYKFEPHYIPVLRMIAGYLSLSTSRNRRYLDSNPLQLFFNDLFAEPQELAGRSELPLIAECFEECQNPAQVRQYEGFIKRVKGYITQPSLSSLDFGRLIRNKNLLHHPTIIHTIVELLSAPQTRKHMLDILINTIETGQRLPPEIVRFIAEVLKNCDNYYADKKFVVNAVYVLEEAVRQGGELTMEALDALTQVIKAGEYSAQMFAAETLQLAAQQGGEFAKKALDVLLQALKEGDYGAKEHAADALASVASKGGEFAKEALDAVMRIFKEDDPNARNNAVHSLAIVAKGEGKFAKEALDALMRILNEGDPDTRKHAANALGIGVQQGGQFAKKALVALIQALKEGNYGAKKHAATSLAVLTKQGREFAKEALVALVGILNEGDPDTSKHAANALAIGVQRGGQLAKKALEALLQALKEGNYGAKKHAAAALAIVAQLGGEIANEVFDDLIQILQEGDRDAKIFAAEVLEVVARQGGEIAKDKLMNLETFRIYPFIFPAFEEQQEQSNHSIRHTSVYEEIALKIFNELGLQDLCHAKLVCKEWKQLIEQTDGWRRFHSKNFKGNSPKHHLQATDQTNHLQSSLSHWKKPQIAELLWHDSSTIISDSVKLKVNTVAAYLHREGFELKGVPSDGDCFFSAFLGSYGHLSRKIPLLEDHHDKISYLRQVLSGIVKHTDSKRAEEIIEKGTWVSGLGEGDRLASALSIPIRLVTVNEEHLKCGVYDSLIFPEAGLSEEDRSQEWKNTPQEKRPKEYIVIVDLGGHFIYAQKP